MRIIAVDDEQLALLNFESSLKELKKLDIEYLGGFNKPLPVLDFVKENHVDLAFLDIEMPGISGIELAKRLKNIDVNIKIVFVTGYDMYALQAFQADAIGYLLKPYYTSDLEKQINKALLMTPKRIQLKNRIVIRTIPKFDIFVDNKLVLFTRSKSKEMLAFLVDKKGSTVTMEEIITALWEDRAYDNKVKILYREAIMNLRKNLEAVDALEIFGVSKGACFVDTSKFDCDLFNILKKDKAAMSLFSGQYMSEYSWAEETTGYLEQFIRKNRDS